MKHTSQAAIAALDAALDRLAASRAANPLSEPSGDPDPPRRRAVVGGAAPPALTDPKITALADERRKRQSWEAETLFRLARKAGLPPEVAQDLASNILPTNKTEWPFIMISPQQNAEVIRWLQEHSKRPHKAVAVWSHLFEVLRLDTGEILRSRDELALRVGISARHVSEIMGELAEINAIRKEPRGRGVRYFMNASVATHLPGETARKEARLADGPLLTLMEGGRKTRGLMPAE